MVNKLILGTVQLGLDYGINNKEGKPSLQKSIDILREAYNNGIRILDTAESYGNSQEVIGKFHKLYPKKKFNIITKKSDFNQITYNDLDKRIIENLKILNVAQLYGYMFHNYESFYKNESALNQLVLIKNQGKIKYLGISLYKNEELEYIINNYSNFDFIQIPFNLLDNESKRKDILTKAKKKKIQIHTRSVFLQGLFFKDSTELPKKISSLISYLNDIEFIKNKFKLSIEELALQYTLQKTYIDYVLIGVDNTKQLINNLEFIKKKAQIPHKIINEINVKNEDLLNPSNWN